MSTIEYPAHWSEEGDFFRDLMPDLLRSSEKLISTEQSNADASSNGPPIREEMIKRLCPRIEYVGKVDAENPNGCGSSQSDENHPETGGS